MMVVIGSECQKNALKKTSRILDTFADRIGNRTWQTVITQEGLKAVKRMLRQTATKNTSVACRWIRGRSRSELLWMVGNRNKFNADGFIAVNTTRKDHGRALLENGWQTTEVIALASGIAGLFHDIGKANNLFQAKLDPKNKNHNPEPYRHEWVSLKLFQAFVADQTDEKWLNSLSHFDTKVEEQALVKLANDKKQDCKWESLPNFAKFVAWLIISHHRLPVYPKEGNTLPDLSIGAFDQFDASWNSSRSIYNNEGNEQHAKNNWIFAKSTPFVSATWQKKAAELSKRAKNCDALIKQDWLADRFTMHIARLVLMLSDHYYSSKEEVTPKWQDSSYLAYANTDKDRQLKQKLDEHNIGVAHNAYLFSRKLPHLNEELPYLYDDNKLLSKGFGDDPAYEWQTKAYKEVKQHQENANTNGFFGINMASTGKGKTFANARILYGLSDPKIGCRFSIALGLRTLTLQTSKALKEKLKLEGNEIATLIGSQAIQDLENIKNMRGKNNQNEEPSFQSNGSESCNNITNNDYDVEYDTSDSDYEGLLKHWFEQKPKSQKLLHAPVLVSTIDHLTPCTEGVRGGKQIVPMLRLLTSDLILDEPDEFGLNDLPAITRLVNWAGLLGAKVLISTATMPPALACALFGAYKEGREAYMSATTSDHNQTNKITCSFFDEFSTKTIEGNDSEQFREAHKIFVNKRVKHLNDKEVPILCTAKLINVDKNQEKASEEKDKTPIELIAKEIHKQIANLHAEHNQIHKNGKKISIGLVRFANIKPLIAVAKQLFSMSPDENSRFHFCIYHSQYPLAQRSFIEEKLDAILCRKDENNIWSYSEIKKAAEEKNEENQVFIVLATPVAEVGRDHDYDWAIAEPSSMRSLIQLAGRIQRHRKKSPKTENFYILSKNYRAISKEKSHLAFEKPGFESDSCKLENHDLNDCLEKKQYRPLNSQPSIQLPDKYEEQKKYEVKPFKNLVTMEHTAYFEKLLGMNNKSNSNKDSAKSWWKLKCEKDVTWCAELQKRQPFRQSSPDRAYCLCSVSESGEFVWKIKNERVFPIEYVIVSDITSDKFNENCIADRNQAWFNMDINNIYSELGEKFTLSLEKISERFGEVRLVYREDEPNSNSWSYHPLLGVYAEL